MILDIFEETTGGRLIQNYNMIGGVQADIHPTFCTKVKEFIAHLRSVIKDYHDISQETSSHVPVCKEWVSSHVKMPFRWAVPAEQDELQAGPTMYVSITRMPCTIR